MIESTRRKLLIIDDEPINLLVLGDLLVPEYDVHAASSASEALAYVDEGNQVDLIISDVMMPGMTGFELCRLLKADERSRDIPLLFLTSLDSAADEEQGLMLGAEDFVRKPVSPPVVLARVRNHLELASARLILRERNARLELLVQERTHELIEQKLQIIASQGAVITAFCSLAEARDNETGNHIFRTQRYVQALAVRLSSHPRFADQLSDEVIRALFRSAPLHDVGKVAIPDTILHKPGPLSEVEWVVMRRHTEYGRDAIAQAERQLGASGAFLRYAREIAFSHHEKWDGSGYPQGLAGEAIPLSARLMAVADVYDALISRRVYKKAFPHEQAVRMIAEGAGKHFDPDITFAFVEISETFREIALNFNDHELFD